MVLYKSLITLGFFGLFRPRELTAGTHTIQIEDVFIFPSHLRVLLRSSKANRTDLPESVDVPAQSVCCPKAMLWQFLQLRSSQPGPLYVWPDGQPVSYNNLRNLFKKLCLFLNLPVSRFTPHSLCIGGTTDLWGLGHSKIFVQSVGRWSSSCFQRYIRC